MFLAYMLHALKDFCKSNCPTPLKPGFIYLQSDAKYSRVLCVYFSMLADKGECVKTFNLGTRGASDKWRKSVKSMPRSLVYIGFDRHPSQMTQQSFKRAKNELYCHAWFKPRHAETAKHRDVETGKTVGIYTHQWYHTGLAATTYLYHAEWVSFECCVFADKTFLNLSPSYMRCTHKFMVMLSKVIAIH